MRRRRGKSVAERPRPRRRAMILIVVLVAVVVLSLSAYTFSDLMLTHYEAVQLSGRQMQARALLDSGADVVRNFLLQPPESRVELGGQIDNPTVFQAVAIRPDLELRDRGNVTILSPRLDADGNLVGVRYGLEDESIRLNLNSLLLVDQVQENGGRELLMQLPGMTETIADSIMDWMDEDDEPREFGAEIEYYSALSPGYAPKNGPFESIEELLLVQGVVPELLFGLDANRNGLVDQHEMAGTGAGGGATTNQSAAQSSGGDEEDVDGGLGSMDRGWIGYLTIYSQESNTTVDGLPRIDVNGDDLQVLYEELIEVFDEKQATFIIAYRLFGPYEEEGGDTGTISIDDLDLAGEAKFPLNQVLDLVGARVQVRSGGENVILEEAFKSDLGELNSYLPSVMDLLTVNPSNVIPGRININEAPKVILAGIPGMTQEILDQILELRQTEGTPEETGRDHETWLLTQAVVSLEEMKALSPFINAGGDVFRAQIVGYFEDGGASARAEVVIDSTAPLPRLVFWRDLSRLGRGFPVEVLGAQLNDDLGLGVGGATTNPGMATRP